MQASGFIALIAAIIVSRFISERAYRELDSDQKLRLMDGFSSTRMYSMIPLLVLVAAFWYLTTKTEINKSLIAAAYFGLLIVYVVVRTILNQRKLVVLGYPGIFQKVQQDPAAALRSFSVNSRLDRARHIRPQVKIRLQTQLAHALPDIFFADLPHSFLLIL